MKQFTVRQIANGFIVNGASTPSPTPALPGANERFFATVAEVATFLTEQFAA